MARQMINGYVTLFSPYLSNHFPVKGLDTNKATRIRHEKIAGHL